MPRIFDIVCWIAELSAAAEEQRMNQFGAAEFRSACDRQLPLSTKFKTRQGDANKSPKLERAYKCYVACVMSACYNISQPNFAILLFLVCSLREYTFFWEDKKVHNMNRLFRQSDIDSYAASLICQSISLKYFIFYTDSCSLISL